MSDTSIAAFGFDVNTAGLRTGSDELTRFEQRLDSAAAAVRRLEAISATALSKISPMMGGVAGPSPMGGAQAAAGLAAQAAAATSAATAHTGLATATAAATTAIGVQANALHGATTAHKAHGAAMGNSTLAALELAHVSRALFDEWAAGGNVMRGFLMEGGRIQLMLSSGGGLAGLFGLVTTKVGELSVKALGLANPFTLGTTAVVGFGAASLLAISHVRSLREEMDRAVSGVGRFSGLSGDGLDALARRATSASASSPTSGLPLDTARGAAEAMARTGRMSPDNIAGGLAMVRGYAAAFGASYDEAGGKLADIFRDPVRGADELNERLGFLDARTRTYIQSLRDQGDAQAAVAALQAVAAPSLNEQVKPPNAWERFSGWWSTRNDQVEHGLARAFVNLTPEERLAAAERDAENRRVSGITSYDPDNDPMNLSENIRRASQLRAQQQRDTIFNRSSLEVDSVIGRLDPDAAHYRQLQNQAKLLGDAAANPDVTSRLPDGMSSSGKLVSGADLLAETLGKISDKLANWMSGVEKSTLAVNANVMGTNAWTLGEHLAAATAQEMASLGIRQIKTSEELIAVQARQVDIIARANDKAFNLDRDATDRLALAGKTGLDRTIAEIHQRYSDYRDQLVDMTGGKDLDGIGTAFLPAKAAATNFATVLDQAAPKLEGAGGHLVSAVDTLATKIDAAAERIAATTLTGPASPFGALDRSAFGGGSAAYAQPMFALMDRAIAAGATPAAAAGFAAGTSMESGTRLNPAADNGSHLGVAQWDGPRWNALVAKLGGGAMSTQAGQFNGIFAELGSNEAGAGRRLLGADSVLGGILASDAYERPGDAEAARRRGEALSRGNALLAAYPGDPLARAANGAAGSTLTIHGGAVPLPPERPSDSVLGVRLDTAGNLASAEGKDVRSATIAATDVPLDHASAGLKNQIALLDTQRDTWGQTAAAIKGATSAQELWNSLVTNSAAPAGELAKQTGALADRVRLYGSEVERVAQRQEDQARMQKFQVDAADFTRGSIGSILSSGTIAAAHGGSFANAAKRTLSGIGDSLMTKGINGAVGALLGGQGSPFGGLLGSLFGGGASSSGGFGSHGPQLPGTGGFLSSVLGPFFGGSHAAGGPIMGPGSGTSDSIWARVSNGEYVTRASAVQHYGTSLLDKINNLSFPKFADGGLVGAPSGTADEPGVGGEGDF